MGRGLSKGVSIRRTMWKEDAKGRRLECGRGRHDLWREGRGDSGGRVLRDRLGWVGEGISHDDKWR